MCIFIHEKGWCQRITSDFRLDYWLFLGEFHLFIGIETETIDFGIGEWVCGVSKTKTILFKIGSILEYATKIT